MSRDLSSALIWSALAFEFLGKLAVPTGKKTSIEKIWLVLDVIGNTVTTLLFRLFTLFETITTGRFLLISMPTVGSRLASQISPLLIFAIPAFHVGVNKIFYERGIFLAC